MKINEIFQKYVNKSYDELMELAQKAMAAIFPYCQQVDKEYDGAFMLANILLACVSSDGKVNDQECKFIAELTGISIQNVLGLVAGLSSEKVFKLTDAFADALDVDAKAAMAALIVTVLACDQRVTVEENKFLRRILG